jgi:trans-aconitate methyltransferase
VTRPLYDRFAWAYDDIVPVPAGGSVARIAALLDHARDRAPAVRFVCADLLTWQPPEPVGAVLCRGVLSDLVDDGDRAAAFAAFASWLAPGGRLVAGAPADARA